MFIGLQANRILREQLQNMQRNASNSKPVAGTPLGYALGTQY
jgi:hypothetical protein